MGLSENWVTLFWGPCTKDPTIKGTILGSPIFGNPHVLLCGDTSLNHNQGSGSEGFVSESAALYIVDCRSFGVQGSVTYYMSIWVCMVAWLKYYTSDNRSHTLSPIPSM